MVEQRSLRTDWYRQAFNELYLLVYAHRSEDRARRQVSCLLRSLRLKQGEWVLDLCCGSGRHLRFLRKAGLQAVGLDLSAALLREAKRKEDLLGSLVRGDMRCLPFEGPFSCVLNLFSSFGYFAEETENEKALAEMVRVLKKGGYLVIDHMNKPYLERNLVPRSEEVFLQGKLLQERRISKGRVEKEITLIQRGREPLHIHESVRIYEKVELECLLKSFGLKSLWWWGEFDGRPLTPDSPRMIVVAKKA